MARQAKIYYQNQLAGYLAEADGGFTYRYVEEYLNSSDPKPISLTIPVSTQTYHSKVLFPFFDGLIPEGWLLEIGEKHWKLNPKNRFELLINLCRDTIGAVSVYPMIFTTKTDKYIRLSNPFRSTGLLYLFRFLQSIGKLQEI